MPCSPLMRAAELHRLLEYFGAEGFRAGDRIRIAVIEQDQRVQIAVAGMKHIRALEAVLCSPSPGWRAASRPGGAAEWCRPCSSRPAPRGPRPERRSCGRPRSAVAPASLPDTCTRVAWDAPQHRAHMLDLGSDLLGRAVGFAQQNRRRIQIVTGVRERLDQPRCGLVEHFQAGRNDPRGDQRRDRVAGIAHLREARHDASGKLRQRHQPHGHFGRDREHALGTDEYRQQIQARRVERTVRQTR